MTKDKKEPLTLTDDDMITSPKISRRVLLAGAGVALGGVALSGRPARAGEGDHVDDDDKDKTDTGEDKDKADAGDDKDQGDADDDMDKADTGEDKDKADEAESDSD